MAEVIGMAPGKVILLGEHAVVYGFPAIGIPINLFSKVIISNNSENGMIINIPSYEISLSGKNSQEIFSKAPKRLDPIRKGIEIWEQQNFRLSNIIITFTSDLWSGSGLGSSASIAIALYRALQLNSKYPNNLQDMINFGYRMEEIAHGQPSGIDNTICAVEKPLLFKKKEYQLLSCNFKASLLIIDSGQPHNTHLAVAELAKLKKQDPDLVTQIMEKIGKISADGAIIFQQGTLPQFQDLMDENQRLLTRLGLMTESMTKLLELGEKFHIHGMKITGAGQGGCLIVIDHHNRLLQFQQTLEHLGIRTHLSQINQNDKKIEG